MSLGNDLLSIYDDVRRNLDTTATRDVAAVDYDEYVVDGDFEMLPADVRTSQDNSSPVSSTLSDRTTSREARLQRVECSLPADVDDRKRPLSVSSTSSSMSSTSSLPRHERKKIATCAAQSALAGTEDATSSGCGGDETNFAAATVASTAGCLSTVVEHVAVIGERCRLNDDDGQQQVERSRPAAADCSCGGGGDGEDVELPSVGTQDTLAREVVDDERGGGRSSTTAMSQSQYVDRVIAEIIETERAYVSDLNQIIYGYLHNIRETCGVKMSSDDISALFGNIESIFSFNRQLLTALENCSSDSVQVADCFVRLNDGFVVYSDYCTNYPRSVETLTKCMADVELAASLRRQQTALQHGLPLGSYLLKPVQRILKYHILLQNIVNNHEAVDPGHGVIESALEGMVGVARSINEMRRQHENAVRIQEVQSHLYGWDGADLTTLGDLVLEDKFRMCGARAFRHVFLFRRAIIIAKKKTEGLLLVKAFIMCSNLMLIESIPREPFAFHLVPFDSPRVQYTLQAMKLEQKRLWCQHIKTLILDNYEAVIPDKAKELVMMLGRSRHEGGEMDERTKKQHDAPEYLERRRGRRRSIGFISELKFRPLVLNGLRKSDSTTISPDVASSTMSRRGLSMLEEDEQIVKHDSDSAVRPICPPSVDDDNGTRTSPSATPSHAGSNDVARTDSSMIDDAACLQPTGDSSTAVSGDLLEEEDPWMPVSTHASSPVHSPARNAPCSAKALSNSTDSPPTTVSHPCDSENPGPRCCTASSYMQCECMERHLNGVAAAKTAVHVDRVLNSTAGLQGGLADIKEGCCDADDCDNKVCGTDTKHSCRQSDSQVRLNSDADTGGSSPLTNSALRPARKPSLNGFRNAVRNVLAHRSSLMLHHASASHGDGTYRSLTASCSSGLPTSAEKLGRSSSSKRLSKTNRRHYFVRDRRSAHSASGSAIDSVRHGLTHLLRAADHGSSVVGERMAVGCPGRSDASTLTLARTRKTYKRVLSGDFDDVDAEWHAEWQRTGSSRTDDDDESDQEFDELTTCAELDSSDSFYESLLSDALETHDQDVAGGFDTDSSDDGTYSAESFSDVAPSDDQPASTASSRDGSVYGATAETELGQTELRRCLSSATETTSRRDCDKAAVSAVSHECHQAVSRVRSVPDVTPSSRRDGGRGRSLTDLERLSSAADVTVTDGSSPPGPQHRKKLSL